MKQAEYESESERSDRISESLPNYLRLSEHVAGFLLAEADRMDRKAGVLLAKWGLDPPEGGDVLVQVVRHRAHELRCRREAALENPLCFGSSLLEGLTLLEWSAAVKPVDQALLDRLAAGKANRTASFH